MCSFSRTPVKLFPSCYLFPGESRAAKGLENAAFFVVHDPLPGVGFAGVDECGMETDAAGELEKEGDRSARCFPVTDRVTHQPAGSGSQLIIYGAKTSTATCQHRSPRRPPSAHFAAPDLPQFLFDIVPFNSYDSWLSR